MHHVVRCLFALVVCVDLVAMVTPGALHSGPRSRSAEGRRRSFLLSTGVVFSSAVVYLLWLPIRFVFERS